MREKKYDEKDRRENIKYPISNAKLMSKSKYRNLTFKHWDFNWHWGFGICHYNLGLSGI